MIIALFLQDQPLNPVFRIIFISIIIGGLGLIVLSRLFIYVEQMYALKNRKPLFRSFVLFKRLLNDNNRVLLTQNFTFYKRLSQSQKKLFEHRLVKFIDNKNFIGRESLIITDEMKILIGATGVMLTFGFRDYLISIISKIIIYPDSFHSNINNQLHNGEFNPQFGALVLSWKHFREGYDVSNDNLNLGIHEFTHAIHFNSIYNSSINSIIFNKSYNELKLYLDSNKELKSRLIKSRYFREYAFTNQFEFAAVIVETFIETPQLFKLQFPVLFNKVRQMLNFKEALVLGL
ncbi:zinc-dependent peptidase [Ichthyenterobacterium sp. W332]|uniref:Zinc-dependent peptidase n=1 Tax=Microcosmobacter mediterraneus TaxID=3075607 RepID=A0ABU2YNM4_9FLAO|nr:zinc-dependent peptidase [Ichthyenterobacterium sp. W332]MDT0559395.1 zinc-dependent peptidase [Ichthyenterobacterium sp. W332]